jgi:hypothetical protein
MAQRRSRHSEIIIRAAPAVLSIDDVDAMRGRRGYGHEHGQAYDALIYTDLDLPMLAPLDLDTAPPNQPHEMAGLPLRAVEHLEVRWGSYQQYLASFVAGGKAPAQMRDRLWETLSSGLRDLFSAPASDARPVRLWWDSDALELVELPWELITTAPDGTAGWLSLVRGLPPESAAPQVPLEGRLRLALIHTGEAPSTLLDRLSNIPGIELVERKDQPLTVLREVAAAGYELVHLFADGYPTLAFDSVLYVHGADPPELPASDLSAVLRGSQVAFMGLTSQTAVNPDMMHVGGRSVPSVYRAFAYLGGSDLPLPSLVAPLGPSEYEHISDFWGAFYATLSETLDVEAAMARGRDAAPDAGPAGPAPMALFLRHRSGHLFRRVTAVRSLSARAAPTQLNAELELSRTLISRLNSVMSKQGESAPASVRAFVTKETTRQERLTAELESWTELEVGDE